MSLSGCDVNKCGSEIMTVSSQEESTLDHNYIVVCMVVVVQCKKFFTPYNHQPHLNVNHILVITSSVYCNVIICDCPKVSSQGTIFPNMFHHLSSHIHTPNHTPLSPYHTPIIKTTTSHPHFFHLITTVTTTNS